MLAPLALVLMAPDPVDAAIARFARTHRLANSHSATIQYKFFPGNGAATGRVMVQKPNLIRFEVNIAGDKYVFVSGKTGMVEYESRDRSYLEFPAADRWYRPPGELLDVSLMFPTPMIDTDLKRWSKNWKLDGPQTGGVTTIATTIQSATGSLRFTVGIDAHGRLVRYTMAAGDGKRGVTQVLAPQNAATIPPSLFNPIPPLGYMASKLPYLAPPMGRESLFPMDGWTSVNGERIRLAQWSSNKTSLVAFVDSSCPRSREMIETLAKNRRQLERQGLRLAAVDTRSQSGWITGVPVLKASNQILGAMRLDGTPYLYMVATNGKIWGMWQGFDSAKSTAFIKEIEKAHKEQGMY